MTSDSNRSYIAPPTIIILSTIILVLFFIVFCSLYIYRCLRYLLNPRRTHGILNSAKKKFPTFTYAAVKDLREDKFALECAICLSDFVDDDLLRLLTTCRHVFHKKCIDLWLDSNDTCPVCRTSLDGPEKLPTNLTTQTSGVINSTDRNEEIGDSIIITIDREIDHHENRAHSEGWEAPPPTTTNYLVWERDLRKKWAKKLSKSHSTGHSNQKFRSIIDEERHTLRLPEHLHMRLISQHSSMRSRSTALEIGSRRLVCGGSARFGGSHMSFDTKIGTDNVVSI